MDHAQLKAQGNAQFAAKQYEAAHSSYTEALALLDLQSKPTGIHLIHGNRAAAALKLGRWASALADAEAALAVEPRWAKALYRKAAALEGLGRPAAAAVAAQQAVTLEPGNRDVVALLARLEQQGEGAAAGGAAMHDQHQQQQQQQSPAAPPQVSGHRRPAPTAALLPPLLARAPWEYIPSPDGMDENLLLLFHGLGDRPPPFASLARRLALPQLGQTAALVLGGPQEVPFSDGGRSWYTAFTDDFDLIEGRPGEQQRIRSLQGTVAALQQLLAALQRSCGFAPRCVHLLGFSQGGTVALELARQQQALGQPLGSCAAISAALLPEQLSQQQQPDGKDGAADSTAVLITRGTLDKVISQQAVEQTAQELRSVHGMAVDVYAVPGKAHTMPQGDAEMRRLMQLWASRLSRRPTAADLPPEVAAAAGELLEIRPGEVSVELVEQDL